MFSNSEERFGPKLNMFVCHCSGEDPSFPVRELSLHTRRANGWQSPKLCEYPQELGFRFEGEVDLQNLRLLVHESKVPSRIEIFVAEATEEERATGAPATTYDRAVFRRLGHVNFCSNEENNFEARELKTVSVRRACVYLKLIIRKPHTNPINMFGQVGIVAISPHGHVLRPFPSLASGDVAVGEQEDIPLDEMTPDARDAAIQEDEAAQDVPEGCDGLDAQTTRKIRELLTHKARAVQEEDYDLAKALKAQIELLKAAGSQISELEEQKKRAVEEEDYDRAKQLKREIDALRAQAQAKPQAVGSGAFPPGQAFGHTAPPMRADYHQQTHELGGAPSPMWSHPPAAPSNRGGSPLQQDAVQHHDVPAQHHHPLPDPSDGPMRRAFGIPSHPSPAAISFDERPAVASGHANIDELVAEGATGGIVAKPVPSSAGGSKEQPVAGNMPDWEERLNKIILRNADDQARAEVLTGAKAQDAKGAQQEFGGYAAACLFSKRFQLREAAVKSITSKDGFAQLPNAHAAAEGFLVYAAHKQLGINDPVAAVYFVVCDGLSALLKGELRGAPSPSSLGTGFGNLLSELMLKAGDSNARVREVAATVLTQIASSDIGPERVASAALAEPENPTKKPLNPRVHIARIHVVSLLLHEVGLNRREVRTGLTPEAIMTKLVLPSLQHSHQDVREGAISLLVDLYRLAPSIAKYFTDLKPALRSLIDERIGTANEAGASPQQKGRAQVSQAHHEPEMVSSSFSVEKGGSNAVLSAARQVREMPPKEEPPAKKPGGKASAKSAAAPPAKPAPTPPEDRASKTCQFCDRYDKRFDEQSFQMHYLQTCPMLCPCPLCGQVTEIANLQNHIVSECDHKTLVRQCPLCKEAVRAEDLEEHVAAKQCIQASSRYNVCPLCHEKLTPAGEVGWKNHLLKTPGCQNNPRPFGGGDGEEFQ